MAVLVATPCDAPSGAGWVAPEDLIGMSGLPTTVDFDLVCDATAETLGMLTYQWYGTVTETVRPVGVTDGCGCYGARFADGYPYHGGLSVTWGSYSGGNWGCGCSCRGLLALDGPVIVDDDNTLVVTIDGVELDPDAVAVMDGMWLVRVDGGSLPCCQSLHLPSTEDGTWAVTYSHGNPVPAAGRGAARVYALEYAKAISGQDCQLTGRIRSVSRDGVSADLIVVGNGDGGPTGIDLVDRWINSVRESLRPHAGRITLPTGQPRGLLVE